MSTQDVAVVAQLRQHCDETSVARAVKRRRTDDCSDTDAHDSDDAIVEWLRSAPDHGHGDDVDDADCGGGSQPSSGMGTATQASQVAHAHVEEINDALERDAMARTVEPLAATLRGAGDVDAAWTDLLKLLESGAAPLLVCQQIDELSDAAFGALLRQLADGERFVLSHAAKTALLDKLVCRQLGLLAKPASRALITAVQRVVKAHGRACERALLAPLLASGGAPQADVVARVLAEALDAEQAGAFVDT